MEEKLNFFFLIGLTQAHYGNSKYTMGNHECFMNATKDKFHEAKV